MENVYLKRYAWPRQEILIPPPDDTKIIVVIPCFNEPDVLQALDALYNCHPTGHHTEVIIVINHAENATSQEKETNIATVNSIKKWLKIHEKADMSFHVISAFNLPIRTAGVGLARKIGMDEAVRRFETIKNKKGIICCFDADCTCSKNYISEISTLYEKHPDANAVLAHFEHPTEGPLPTKYYEAIIRYELHLRYYVNALKIAQFPWAFQTIGSCITISSRAYQKQGGMNKRKAGEDFYFLQKIFPLGDIYELSSATIFPSARASDRVPFGTGKAISKYLAKNHTDYHTYHPLIFEDFRQLNLMIPGLYQSTNSKKYNDLPKSIIDFLTSINFHETLKKLLQNCNTETQFYRSFYQWFNGFTALKYIHFARDRYYPNVTIEEAISWLFDQLYPGQTQPNTLKNALISMRNHDRLHH